MKQSNGKRLAAPAMHQLARLGGAVNRSRPVWMVYGLAFFLPFVIVGLLWALHGVWPFGSKMILAHDQWHQYYPFFLDLRRRLQEGHSLTHSWTTGLGTSYLPLFAYYLASPMNLLAALLPDSLVLPYYTLTVLVKISLCGLFYAVFLKNTFHRCDFTVSVFSTMFALCAFVMGYYWNAIWLDTVALVPLVALGTVQLLRDGRCVLYVFSLALAVYCSYYMGFFVCVFVLLLFICWHIVNWDDLGGFWARFFRIGLCTLLALGLTAALTLPTLMAMRSTSSAVNKFPQGFQINMGSSKDWAGVLDALRQTFSNTGALVAPTTMEGRPNLYCGVATLVMAALYCFCRRIPLRERLCCVGLLLFFAAGFIFRQLDYVLHGFHFPNMLPYRFSFLWSFVVIFMAYRAFNQLSRLRWWHCALALLPLGAIFWCVLRVQGLRTILATGVLMALVLGGVLLYTRRRLTRNVFTLGLCCLLLLESVCGAMLGVHKVSVTDGATYPVKKEDTAAVVQTMQTLEADTVDLWRAEVATKQSLNDSTLLGFNGVSTFSSAANSRVSAFAQRLGIAASVAGNRYIYQEADPFTNLLLGVKYLIDRDGRYVDPTYFSLADQSGDVMLLKNSAYLPQGFLVRETTLEYDGENTEGTCFDRLNRLHRLMTGDETSLFEPLPMTSMEPTGTAELTSSAGYTFHGRVQTEEEESALVATFEIPYDGSQLCVYSITQNCNDVVLYLNGQRQYAYSDKYGYNRYFGSFASGDRVELWYRPKADKDATVTVNAALFQDEVFRRMYDQFAQHQMITTLVTDTEIEGVIRAEEAGVLYTSIPNDDGWQLTVDGEPQRLTSLDEALLAVRLEPGLHTVNLKFEAPGLDLGMKISFVCLGLFLVLVVLALLRRVATRPMERITLSMVDPEGAYPQGQTEDEEDSWTEEDWMEPGEDAGSLEDTQVIPAPRDDDPPGGLEDTQVVPAPAEEEAYRGRFARPAPEEAPAEDPAEDVQPYVPKFGGAPAEDPAEDVQPYVPKYGGAPAEDPAEDVQPYVPKFGGAPAEDPADAPTPEMPAFHSPGDLK